MQSIPPYIYPVEQVFVVQYNISGQMRLSLLLISLIPSYKAPVKNIITK